MHFPIIDNEAGSVRHRCNNHFQPHIRGGDRRLVVWWNATGQQPNLFEMQALEQFQRRAQMAEVDRVKSTAENADRFHVNVCRRCALTNSNGFRRQFGATGQRERQFQ